MHAEKVIKSIAQWIDSLGYMRILIKSDKEPSIVAVQEAVKLESSAEMVPENTPAGESQSNGNIESAIRELGGMIWTLKHSIES